MGCCPGFYPLSPPLAAGRVIATLPSSIKGGQERRNLVVDVLEVETVCLSRARCLQFFFANGGEQETLCFLNKFLFRYFCS